MIYTRLAQKMQIVNLCLAKEGFIDYNNIHAYISFILDVVIVPKHALTELCSSMVKLIVIDKLSLIICYGVPLSLPECYNFFFWFFIACFLFRL